MAKALADRLAEAFAELLHERARRDWGYGRGRAARSEELIAESYRGIRPALRLPGLPRPHREADALPAARRRPATGIHLTESFAMWPAASVSGLYFAHPEARYFAVGRVTSDQVEDYARRKGISVKQAERFLSVNLSYDPT